MPPVHRRNHAKLLTIYKAYAILLSVIYLKQKSQKQKIERSVKMKRKRINVTYLG